MYCMGMYILNIHVCTVHYAMIWMCFVFFLIQLATPQMTCSSCGRQETLCRWMKLLYHSLTSDRKISIMGTAPNTMQEQVQSVFIILYIMCRFFGESVSPESTDYGHILMPFSGNVDNVDGDILDSEETLTFDHPTLIGQDQRPRAFWV